LRLFVKILQRDDEAFKNLAATVLDRHFKNIFEFFANQWELPKRLQANIKETIELAMFVSNTKFFLKN
jgi:hypothetical protein